MRRILNIPNVLTLLRIAAIPFILYFLSIDTEILVPYEFQTLVTYTHGRMATLLFVIAGITDLLDGWIARKYQMESNFGRLIDPLADKLIVTGALVLLVHLARVPWYLVVLLLAREMAASTLRAVAAGDGLMIPALRLGKYKQFLLIVGVSGLMFNGKFIFFHSGKFGLAVLYLALISSYLSFTEYLMKYLKAMDKSPTRV
jgi:CDP-diacylglycerol--glycerol-3-phosphate 3-phosphatidyltransferase